MNFFNWRIIALQNFVVFCHISTRISHRYTHVHSFPNLCVFLVFWKYVWCQFFEICFHSFRANILWIFANFLGGLKIKCNLCYMEIRLHSYEDYSLILQIHYLFCLLNVPAFIRFVVNFSLICFFYYFVSFAQWILNQFGFSHSGLWYLLV